MKKQKISYKNCNLKALRHLKNLSALTFYAKIIEACAKVDQLPKNVYYMDVERKISNHKRQHDVIDDI